MIRAVRVRKVLAMTGFTDTDSLTVHHWLGWTPAIRVGERFIYIWFSLPQISLAAPHPPLETWSSQIWVKSQLNEASQRLIFVAAHHPLGANWGTQRWREVCAISGITDAEFLHGSLFTRWGLEHSESGKVSVMTGFTDADIFDCALLIGDELQQSGLEEGSVTFGFTAPDFFDWASFAEELVQSELGEVFVTIWYHWGWFLQLFVNCWGRTGAAWHWERSSYIKFHRGWLFCLFMILPGGVHFGTISSLGF